MSDSILHVSNVSVAFGGLKALTGVSFDVGRSEVFGIIGPNGAGKTTLLNVLSRMITPSRGAEIVLEGSSILSHPAYRLIDAGLGRTFQSLELSNADTILGNVLAGATRIAERRGLAWCFLGDFGKRQILHDATERARGILDSLGITRFASQFAADVPYAVKKRAQIGRALMGNPRLLLLDEPASGMEQAEKRALRDTLVELHQNTGMSLVIIEHDVGFLTSMCTRMLALDFGRVIAFGPTAEVIAAPAVLAAYLGVED